MIVTFNSTRCNGVEAGVCSKAVVKKSDLFSQIGFIYLIEIHLYEIAYDLFTSVLPRHKRQQPLP
jgi:hypothetical protein